MSQGALTIANGSGGTVRAAINAALARLASGASGTGRPADIAVYECWTETDNPGAGIVSIWQWDGTNDVLVAIFDTVSHSITLSPNAVIAEDVTADAFLTTDANVNFHSGASTTLVAGDNGRTLLLQNSSAITLTIPNTLPVGFCCTVVQTSSGQVTFTAGGGVTLRQRNGLKTAGQYAAASLVYLGSNTYLVAGDVTP